ncbi:MAG: 1-acyl-sn-glycerol-3-phosphate acyltransferase [Bacteroidota bacterium]
MTSGGPVGKRVAVWAVSRLIERSLRSDFRRVVWLGPKPWTDGTLDPERPLVLYTNHHSFFDGYLLWLLTRRVLGRPPMLWMNEWERVPLFGPLGALPFPPDDPRRRLATIRETARRLRAHPPPVFLYFPEGELGPPDAGLAAFPPERFTRLARFFPDAVQWWPVGLRVTWWGEDRPTALMTGGAPHDAPDGGEHARLGHTLDALRGVTPGDGEVLLDGTPSADERWDLSLLAPLLRRWT